MKKRIAYTAVGVLALSVGIYVTAKLWAQQPQPQPQRAQTRIGMMNMAAVLKGYHKFEQYNNEMKDKFTQFDTQSKTLKKQIEDATKAMQDPANAQRHEEYQKYITAVNRQLEDQTNEMKKKFSEQSDAQMIIIYKDIQEATARYAQSQGLDMVVTYMEALNPQDQYSPMNIMGKLQQRAFLPMYYNPSMDVTADILDTLNKHYDATKTGTPTSAPAPGAPPAH